jgi:sulfite dehydrogenase (cytochrome) subunit B
MRILPIILLAAFAITPCCADEKPIELKKAPGVEKVEVNCAACHSLDYIQMNSPFLSPAGWDAETAKMIKLFGAPITDSDAAIIADYLTNNYGGSPPSPTTTNGAQNAGRTTKAE